MRDIFEIFTHYVYITSRMIISIFIIILLFNLNRLINKFINK